MTSIQETNFVRKNLASLKISHLASSDLAWIDEFVDSVLMLQNSLSRLRSETEKLMPVLSKVGGITSPTALNGNGRKRSRLTKDLERFADDLQKLYAELYGGGITSDHIFDYITHFDREATDLADQSGCLRGRISKIAGWHKNS